MLSTIAPIFLIIIGGLINGSFVIPSKYIKNFDTSIIWFFHTIIGLSIIPWIFLFFISPDAFYNYTLAPTELLLLLAFGGAIFGLGQIWFSQAIQLIGISLSFVINLGVGLIIGSMFVIFYESAFLTNKGFYTTLSTILILLSLMLYYQARKTNFTDSKHQINGWIFALLAGLTSGLQNITFIIAISNFQIFSHSNNLFWVWPPFLLAAAIPMFFVFLNKTKDFNFPNQSIKSFLTIKNIVLVTIMGLFFSGSLAFYSYAMSNLNDQEKIIGWPAFIVSTIFVSQIWGIIYKEDTTKGFKNKSYRFFSLLLLIIAVVIISITA